MSKGWKMQRSDCKKDTAVSFDEDPTEQKDVSPNTPKIAELSAILAAHNAQQAPPRWPNGVLMPIWVDKPRR